MACDTYMSDKGGQFFFQCLVLQYCQLFFDNRSVVHRLHYGCLERVILDLLRTMSWLITTLLAAATTPWLRRTVHLYHSFVHHHNCGERDENREITPRGGWRTARGNTVSFSRICEQCAVCRDSCCICCCHLQPLEKMPLSSDFISIDALCTSLYTNRHCTIVNTANGGAD